jgi:tripartite-type tricarboxylate transporter receptor subunit TctC
LVVSSLIAERMTCSMRRSSEAAHWVTPLSDASEINRDEYRRETGDMHMTLPNGGSQRLGAVRTTTAAYCLLILMVSIEFAPTVFAQDYPSRPIRWVVAFPPGGAADVLTRGMAPALSEALGQRIVVDNRSGAGGNIGADIVAKAAPDGYTLLMGFPGLTTNPSLYAKMSYDPIRDLAPVMLIAVTPAVLVVHPAVPAKSLKELIDFARANPGKLNYASAGIGAAGHMSGELFKMLTRVDITHVAYKGGGPALVDLMAGQVQMLFDSIPTAVPLVRAGKLRALAIAGKARSQQIPDVPTFEESGVSGFDGGTWFGVLVPFGTEQPVIAKIHAALSKVIALPETVARFRTLGLNTVAGTPQEFAAFLKQQTTKWKKVIEAGHIKLE